MKWFYNMRISMKLISCFIVVAIISGVVGVIGISNITRINNNDTILYENMTVPLSEVADMARWFQRSRVNARDMILYDNPADIQDSYKDVMTYVANVEAIANSFEKTIIQEEVNKYFEDWKKAWADYKKDLEILLEMCLENRDEEAFAFTRGELQDAANAVREANDKLIELKVTGARNQTESNDAAAETATVTMVVVIAVAMVIAILLGIFTSRIISNPMRNLAAAADKIADGDLDVHIDIYTKEEIGQLANAFNKMVDNLNELISGINNAADQVAAGAKQVSDSSFELSKGAAEQASTIEELTASLEELSIQTRLNAENSNQANSLSEVAKENAEQGRIQMEDMLKAMEEINQSSNNISKIIKVIDDIAFQTNIPGIKRCS